jgi:hypothetical protein
VVRGASVVMSLQGSFDSAMRFASESHDCAEDDNTERGLKLAHDQDFANVVASQEEFNRRKIAEEIFDVTVIEHSL